MPTPKVKLAPLLLLCGGCAAPLVSHVPPIPPHPIPVGINSEYHGYSTDGLAAVCPAMLRTPQTSGQALKALVDAAPGCPVLALVEAPDLELVRQFARAKPAAIELGNELELTPYELTPEQYGQWITRALVVLKDEQYTGTIVLGGVYAITPETKKAILQGVLACLYAEVNCVAAVHLYDASDEDLNWLRWLTATYHGLRVWVTEFGTPDRCEPARLAAKRDYLASQIARFSTVPGVERVFIYQRLRGPTCRDLDTFGIDGQPAMGLLSR